ncbi:MAG: hypothetical protein H0V05_12380 [Euzebyaceae bacterium]|nr:hypothetical protein [Euzebyaceae bacterium]
MRRLLGAVSAGALVALLAGAPAATAQACRVDEHTMASGDPATAAGGVSLTVDGLGWFGVASFGAREARYRPPGGGPELSTVQESVVAVDGVRLQECVTGDAEVVERTPNRFTTTGAVGLTRVQLVQELSPVAADGSTTLTQRYELAPGRLDVSHLDAVRSLAPLLTEGGAVTAAAGRRGGTLAASVPGDGRAAAVGIAGDLDGRAAPDRWTVAAVGEAGTDARMLPAGIAN